MAEIWNNASALRQASCALAASKQRQVTLKSSILLFLVWLSGCSSKSFMERTTCSSCALCALCCQASLCTAQPHPHCFLRHKEGAGAGSTSSSAVSLTTNDMEKSSSAGAFATTIDWRSDGVFNRRSTRKLDRRLSGTRTRVRVAETCAKRPTASRWWTRRSSNWSRCMRKLGKFQFAGDNGVVDTIQDEADVKTPLPDSKIRPIGPAWSSDSTVKPQWQGSCRCFHALSPKAGATFTWFCLRVMSREEISMPAKICLSKINWFVFEHKQPTVLTIASRYYQEIKQKLFDVVNYSVR